MKSTRKVSKAKTGLQKAIAETRELPRSWIISGRAVADQQLPDRILIVENPASILSISKHDILATGKGNDGFDFIKIRSSAQILRTHPDIYQGQAEVVEAIRRMEELAPPPPPKPGKDDPKQATQANIDALISTLTVAKSIAGAAATYAGSCAGGDSYNNNCAHYLSDAFIRAGYTELNPPNDCIDSDGRCGTSAKRPIRARNMWCWFKEMATKSATTLPKNDGFWAVFQLDETAYWGGHVVIIDTDNNVSYGTGNYPDWDQYAYKW
ncbi:MAG: hypothetical protein ACKVP5_17765 [Aestuariivirga sp.]